MKKIKSGLAFHVHHDHMVEWCYNFDERVKYIKAYKPIEEQELRLRLFKPIPEQLISGRDSKEYIALDKAWAALGKAWVDLDKAWAALGKAWVDLDKARVAHDKAWVDLDKARVAHDKAWVAYLTKYRQELENLHKELCPDCTWNGWTIFPDKQKKYG